MNTPHHKVNRTLSKSLTTWGLTLLVSLALPFAANAQTSVETLAQNFTQPPVTAWPWVYWFPLDGNISSNGITLDLEAMKRVGIGGVLYMETSQNTPPGPAKFAGPLWRELFKHACAEANRLGMEINMNNDAGWCGSGGPWIPPEMSMQKVVWTETVVNGGKPFNAPLVQPTAVKDYYRDIAVLAVPVPVGDEVKMSDLAPRFSASTSPQGLKGKPLMDENASTSITLPKPERNKPQWVQVEFAQPFLARQLTLQLKGSSRSSAQAQLQVSDDGLKFKTVREFGARPPSTTISFPDTSARFYRVAFTRADAKFEKPIISELELSPRYRIEQIDGKSALTVQINPPMQAQYPALPAGVAITRDHVLDLSTRMSSSGVLSWEPPAGQWLVLRFGHTSTGKDNHPAPIDGRGLECDKLSKEAAELHFNSLMGKLIKDVGPLAGKTLVTTHIDSWEVGSQNWTPKFREEFMRRRGYDPLTFLPVMTGRFLESTEVSERFLWDVRMTVNDLLLENYAGHFRELAHKNGLRLSIEAYGQAPCMELPFAGRADEPMSEFWAWARFGAAYSCTEMASAAHVYGQRILGAEAFTSRDTERWLGHPGNIKDIGDWAFCEGINRFVFHRYALQPWSPEVRPGISMGPWGLHYERTQTWWEQSIAWHQYLARCQYLLRQGLFVADICYLSSENSPQRWSPPQPRDKSPYNFDGCPPEVLFTRMQVNADGHLVLPDGMSYRVLVLPDVEVMTPALLSRIKTLVAAGATVIGNRPLKSPSLSDYPRCDAEVKQLADELWGNCDGKQITEHRHGKGRIVMGKTAEQVLASMNVAPDFSAEPNLRYIHRSTPETEIYFVANPSPNTVETLAHFRVADRAPELWYPDTGRRERPAVFTHKDGRTTLPLRLDQYGSVFVLFPNAKPANASVATVSRNGEVVLPPGLKTVKPRILKASYGVLEDPARTRNVKNKLQALVDSGTTTFRVSQLAQGDDPAYRIVKTLVAEYEVSGQTMQISGVDTDTLSLNLAVAGAPNIQVTATSSKQFQVEAWQPGHYDLRTTSGQARSLDIPPLPASVLIGGAWEVQFAPRLGAPERALFPELLDWSKHKESGIKYFSGTATYRKTFQLPPGHQGADRRHYLDLGKVAVMAQIKLNGHDLGILWKTPYQVDITEAMVPGDNQLEIQVVNLWVNRQIGDEQLAEDSDRNANGTLKNWPAWLEANQPSPAGRFTFTSHRLWKKDDVLQESGLIGPVQVHTTMVKTVEH